MLEFIRWFNSSLTMNVLFVLINLATIVMSIKSEEVLYGTLVSGTVCGLYFFIRTIQLLGWI